MRAVKLEKSVVPRFSNKASLTILQISNFSSKRTESEKISKFITIKKFPCEFNPARVSTKVKSSATPEFKWHTQNGAEETQKLSPGTRWTTDKKIPSNLSSSQKR